LLTKYHNNSRLVLSAYNSGEAAVDRCHCVPAVSRAYVNRIEQSRFFAKRIVQYVHNNFAPSPIQDAPVPQMNKQPAELKATDQFLLPILASLFTLALTVRTARFRAAAVTVAILALLAVFAVERLSSSSELVSPLESRANSTFDN